jgi:hypothetical protein
MALQSPAVIAVCYIVINALSVCTQHRLLCLYAQTDSFQCMLIHYCTGFKTNIGSGVIKTSKFVTTRCSEIANIIKTGLNQSSKEDPVHNNTSNNTSDNNTSNNNSGNSSSSNKQKGRWLSKVLTRVRTLGKDQGQNNGTPPHNNKVSKAC